jgi:hypothetical protein
MVDDPDFIRSENTVTFDDARSIFPNAAIRQYLEEGDELAAILKTFIDALDRLDADMDDIYDNRFIESATNEQLELLAANVGVERKSGESETSFRSRTRAGYLIAISEGTYEDVAKATLALLNTGSSGITFENPPNTNGGVGRIELQQTIIDDSALTQQEIADELTEAVPLGHRIEIISTDTWRLGESGAQGLGQGGLR